MDPSPNPVEEFARAGATSLGQVLDADELAAVLAAFEEALDGAVTGPYARIVHDGWRKSPVLARLAEKVGRIACQTLGLPQLVLFHEHLLWKDPGGVDMDWHQDYSYLPLDRPDGLTLWIALDECSPENGCLYYLFGSHLLGERRASWGIYSDDDPRAALPPLDVPDHEPGVAAPARAGCGLAHHANLWHRSPANHTDSPRRTWALSFAAPEAVWAPRHAAHPRSAIEPRYEGQPLEDDLLRVTTV